MAKKRFDTDVPDHREPAQEHPELGPAVPPDLSLYPPAEPAVPTQWVTIRVPLGPPPKGYHAQQVALNLNPRHAPDVILALHSLLAGLVAENAMCESLADPASRPILRSVVSVHDAVRWLLEQIARHPLSLRE